MKALVLWADPTSTNLGVRALAAGTTSLLQTSFPGIAVSSQSYGAGDAPVRIGTARGQLRRLASRHDELVEWVRRFDVVVDTRAGDSFADIYGLERLTTMSLMGEIVRRSGVPLVLGPQTIGPFGSRRGRLIARRALRSSAQVFARDAVSRDAAAALGRPVDQLATDVVFALPQPTAVTRSRDVVLNVSGLLWAPNSHVESDRYRNTVRALAAELVRRGRRVALLAHVLSSPLADDDVDAVRALAADLNEAAGRDDAVEVLVPQGLDDVRALLATAQVVVGSRMHACLNALSMGRPAVPLAYSRKFAPLLSDIGWTHTVDLRDAGTDDDHVAAALAAIEDPALERDAELVGTVTSERVAATSKVLSRVC